ncbi:GntR family transcriptional regulator [Phenylobacterium sp.]|uniref:GntR family transcriptional regulator n=1 Tax=Phenylobacterium sp. TaxID=1871053 RepID=UPI0012146E31|nr:GntR family transcriptional regulator [Phenylobacterium sp.]THD61255.1 MAG: GntR family transcriptional regulator [Phenylobacterium sp.]
MGNAEEPPRRPGRGRGDDRAAGPTAAEVTERLRRQIQDGVWTPGEWMREPRLCTEFEVGRSIVRRALRNLADDGLVILEPNRGASVTVTTLQEVFDLYELRSALYGVAARYACIRASAALMAEILEKSDTLLAASESGETAEELIRQSEVIFRLMAGTASADAQAAIAAVRRKTRWHISYKGLALSPPGPFDHWRVMRAGLAARDPARAAEGARNILYYMQTEVSRLMLSRGLGMKEPAKPPAARRRKAAAG